MSTRNHQLSKLDAGAKYHCPLEIPKASPSNRNIPACSIVCGKNVVGLKLDGTTERTIIATSPSHATTRA
jgi:hypothetical protein